MPQDPNRPCDTPNRLLEGRGLTRHFGERCAVRDVSIALASGELYGVIGPDGAGKTTLLRMLTGLLEPDAGQVRVEDRPVSPKAQRLRELIGYMPQHYSLYGDLSVHENLHFFGELFGLSQKARHERTNQLLEITRLSNFGDRSADDLSGGMYKKLALACALLHRPEILVLDEPSNGVDPVSRRELWDLLYDFVDEGMAVLLATPDMSEASRCHRVGLLHHGQMLAEDSPQALREQFAHATYQVRSDARDTLEDQLHDRDEVLAISPEGQNLRVVVRQGDDEMFRSWVRHADPAVELDDDEPSFEDVFLGLVSSKTSNDATRPDGEGARG